MQKKIKAGLVVIFTWFFLCGVPLPGVEPGPVIFDHLSIKDGLSQTTVTCILQDRTGFMWFGTLNGLNKYDGYTFEHYYPVRGNRNSLTGNNIISLCEGADGNLWIGTMNGLNRFFPRTGRFENFRSSAGGGGLGDGTITTLREHPAGTLWIGTRSRGLYRMDIREKTFTHYRNTPAEESGAGGNLSSDFISSLYPGDSGEIWIGTMTGGLNRLDPGSGKVTVYKHDPRDPHSISYDIVGTLFKDSEGVFWVGTVGGGLNRFDRESGRFTVYASEPGNPRSLPHNQVFFLFEDSSRVLWVGTMGGLAVFDRESGTFSRFLHDPGNPGSLSTSAVSSMVEDRSGILWVGTIEGGINFFDRRRRKFQYLQPGARPGVDKKGEVTGICRDRDGMLWLGTVEGLYRYDGRRETFTLFRHDPADAHSLSHNRINAVLEDRDGNIWAGTSGGGLNTYDPGTRKFRHYRNRPGVPGSISSDRIMTLHEAPGGTIWVGAMYPGGLNRFHPQTGTFTVYTHDPGNPGSLSHPIVTSILTDSSGILWVGTQKGLNRFDAGQGTFTRYTGKPGDMTGISSDRTGALLETRDGTLWVGTHGGGINRFNRVTGTFDCFDTLDGLPDNMIHGMLEDGGGNLWISSGKGICCFTPASGAVKLYTPRDGLQGYEFNVESCYKSPGGEMFFGGVNGLNIFHPDRMVKNQFVPPVVFTGLKISNRPVGIEPGGTLPLHINAAPTVNLSYRDTMFSLEFAALDYSHPEQNQYKYMLEGLSNRWVYLGQKRDLDFTGLDPGHYILKVMGTNGDGKWNPVPSAIAIEIAPPFWNRMWFKTLAVFLAVMAIYLVHRLRLKNLSLKIKSENQMERLHEKYNLSNREKEILQLILKGKTNKEIEDALFISMATVKSHVYSIFRKLKVKSRLELIHYVQKSTRIKQ